MTEETIINQVINHLNIFFIASMLSLFIGLLAWQKGFFCKGPTRYVPVRGRDVFRGFAYFILVELVVVPALILLFFSFFPQEEEFSLQRQGWTNIVAILAGLGAVLTAFFQISSPLRSSIWGDSTKWYKHLLIGALTWLVSYPFVLAVDQIVSIVLLLIFQKPPVDQVAVSHFKNMLADPLLLGLTAFGIIFLVPIAEELLFRGLLQSWVKEKVKSPYKAIMITSLVFSFFHFSSAQGTTNIELIVSLFLLSCFLGYLYERQKSLWASIGLHSFFNAMSIIMIIKG